MTDTKTIKVGLLGLGTVGTGVYKLIGRRSEEMQQKTGAALEIKKILVHNMKKVRQGVDQNLLTDQWKEIIEDDEIQIVIEVMGGIEPAKTMITEALKAGKNVVSANKDLIAEYGKELYDAAKEGSADFLFEAAVAGGIPIIRPLKQCLEGNQIDEIMGIVNGTTNYILTKMSEEGMDYQEALAKATELGYAEADPTADVEGYDAGRKIAIMSSLAFNSRVTFDDVYMEGITKITADDFKYAKVLNRSIKLLASSRKVGNSYSCMVAPFMLSAEHPLCGVNGVFNGIFVHGNVLGDAMFYGSGAGKLPTASAVVADIVDMTKHKNTNIYIDWSPEKLTLVDYKDSVNSFFVRTSSGKETIENAFGSVEYADAGIAGEIGFTTKDMTEAEFEKAAAQIEVRNRIRLG